MDSRNDHTDSTAIGGDLVVTRAFDAFGALVLASGRRSGAAPRPAERPWTPDPAPASSALARSR
jgi:hypothetical protein